MKKVSIFIFSLLCALNVTAQISTTNDTTNIVYIMYGNSGANVIIASNIIQYVSATINDNHVSIKQSESVGLNTCGEIIYALSGSSNNGSFYMEGAYKSTVEFHGLNLTNPSGPAVNIQNGKRIEISAKRETVNTLTDGTSSDTALWKGCLQCKGHIEFKGYGTLNIYANYAHGIWSKEYITVKNCTINVYSAVKDAINCNQYFSMESGTVNLSGFGDDGIQVSLKNLDTSAENTGNFTLNGGTININMDGASGSSVKTVGTQTVNAAAKLNVTGSGTGFTPIVSEQQPVRIYLLIGTYIGEYPTLEDAMPSLPNGNYLIVSPTECRKIHIAK